MAVKAPTARAVSVKLQAERDAQKAFENSVEGHVYAATMKFIASRVSRCDIELRDAWAAYGERIATQGEYSSPPLRIGHLEQERAAWMALAKTLQSRTNKAV